MYEVNCSCRGTSHGSNFFHCRIRQEGLLYDALSDS